MLSAWPSASQTETQDSPAQSSHENTAGRRTRLAMAYDEITLDHQNISITMLSVVN